jgi:nucleoside-triphosphatase
VPVLATVAMKGGGLIAEAKAREDVRLVEVAEENRDTLPAELEAWVRERREE